MARVIAWLLALLLGVVPAARAQYIGLYTESDPVLPTPADMPPATHALSLPVMTPTTVYIVAHVTGSLELEDGLTGAEFAITGLPPLADLVALETTANPQASVALGEPFSVGAKISFPLCVNPTANQAVTLYAAQIIALNPVGVFTASVGAHQFPSNPSVPEPLLFYCNSLVEFPAVAVTAVPLRVQPPVAVPSRTWSAIKRQFR